MAASDPIAPEHVMEQRVPLGSSIAGRVILTEQAVYLPDLNLATMPGPNRRVSTGVRSYLGVPLVADGRAIGVLQVDSSQSNAWSDADRATFLCAAPVVAAAIQNARSQDRVSSAQSRTEAIEKRLTDARHLVAAARASVRNGDRLQLERQLSRIDELLSGTESSGTLVRLPRQRADVAVPIAR